MKIYISGKITGDPGFKEKFKKAEEYLKKQFPDATIINPAEIVLPECCVYEDYIVICLYLLQKADAIYMLSDWSDSKGARMECCFAESEEIPIYFQKKSVMIL